MSSGARVLLRGWKLQQQEERSRRNEEALRKNAIAIKMTVVRGEIAGADLEHTLQENLMANIEMQRKRGDLSHDDALFWERTHHEEDDMLKLLFARLQHKESELQKLQADLDALA